jgi:hypothetical protein
MPNRKHLAPVIAGFALALSLPPSAMAKPATAADLSGKTICYDNGERETYMPGGKYVGARHGSGTWSISAGGVEIHAQSWSGIHNVEKLPDGTFTYSAPLGNGGIISSPGKYCK